MVDVERHSPGDFCWPELATTDAAGAKAFYGPLFGWETVDTPAGPDMTYTMCLLRGREAAALYQMGPAEKGVPPHWNAYAAVERVDDAAARVSGLGGKVLMPPFDVMDVGRMAVVSDPEGAVFCLWQAAKHAGARVRNEPGAYGWHELTTRDVARAKTFYAALFPTWTLKPSANAGPAYLEIWVGDRPIGGLMDVSTQPEIPSAWTIYFETADCRASAEKARAAGAFAIVPPKEIPGVGTFAVLRDPQGAVFSVIELEKRK